MISYMANYNVICLSYCHLFVFCVFFQGIPSHVDTHSPFEDAIISLSLGSQVQYYYYNNSVSMHVY